MAGLVGGWLAYALTLLGGYLAVFGATLCLSCGLYYAAELAEEHSVLTGRLLGYATRAVVAAHAVLWLDGYPLRRVAAGVACHACYAWLLNDYPRLELSSPAFLASVAAFLGGHYSWFQHLADLSVEPLPFINSLGFFTLFVWLVPFSLFISLSINDNALPFGATAARPKSTSAFRRVVDGARGAYESVLGGRVAAAAAAAAPREKYY
jgi:hypothetical protein